jgi:hypothetical protein
LVGISKIIKEATLEEIKKVQEGGEREIDLATFTRDLQSQIILNVLVGQKFAHLKCDYEQNNGQVVKRSLVEVILDTFAYGVKRALQPLNVLIPELSR